MISEYQNFNLKMISIYSKNREEWLFTDLACILFGISVVPLYDTLGPDTIQYVLGQTNVTTIFASGESLKTLVKQNSLHKVKQIVCFDSVLEEDK